ncbi:uncharacterized protein [Aristolochia californica]|uniref:uncharacterized protein n=1 Tax=Aristolochia californica TaxID=171875 RepID=UPI0035D76D78
MATNQKHKPSFLATNGRAFFVVNTTTSTSHSTRVPSPRRKSFPRLTVAEEPPSLDVPLSLHRNTGTVLLLLKCYTCIHVEIYFRKLIASPNIQPVHSKGDKGNKTDIVISSYDDHFLVIVTQIGSMGTILYARKEETVAVVDPIFNVSVLFGKRDEPMLVACARQLIEHISRKSSRPLVISLGLKDHSLNDEALKSGFRLLGVRCNLG